MRRVELEITDKPYTYQKIDQNRIQFEINNKIVSIFYGIKYSACT